jgi:hypothetical protein
MNTETNTEPLKPGDNPNTTNKQKSKKITPYPKGDVKKVQNIVENIDPIIPKDFDVEGLNFRSTRTPGTRVIARVTLRKEFVDELVRMSRDLMRSRLDILEMRMRMAYPLEIIDILVYIGLATQAYNTLPITNQESPSYKLKALKFTNFVTPDWLITLINTIGNYNTSEGIVAINAIEQLVPQWTLRALSIYSQIDPDFQINEQANQGLIPIYNSTNFKEDLYNLLVMQNQAMFGKIGIRSAAGMVSQVTIDWLNDPVHSLLSLVTDENVSVIEGRIRLLLTSYLRIREASFAQAVSPIFANDLNVLGLYNGEQNFSISRLVELLGRMVPKFNSSYSNIVDLCFKSSPFTPSLGGTSAQFVKPHSRDEAPSEYSSQGEHVVPISVNSGMIGLMLSPALSTTYAPFYTVDTELSRFRMMETTVRKFAPSAK